MDRQIDEHPAGRSARTREVARNLHQQLVVELRPSYACGLVDAPQARLVQVTDGRVGKPPQDVADKPVPLADGRTSPG